MPEGDRALAHRKRRHDAFVGDPTERKDRALIAADSVVVMMPRIFTMGLVGFGEVYTASPSGGVA